MNLLRVSSSLKASSHPCSSCISGSSNNVYSSPLCHFSKFSVLSCAQLSPISSTRKVAASLDEKKREVSRAWGFRNLRRFDNSSHLCCDLVMKTRSFRWVAVGDASSGGGEPDTEKLAEGFTAEEIDKKGILISGSPIVVVEAPQLLKSAEPMPMMRPNRGLIKPGDAGRVIDRRPKNMWAVRFAVGAYLIDRKCFEPLEE